MAYRFNQFEFDAEALVLARAGGSVPLKPQAALFLRTLLAAAPRAVTRDQLISVLWPDGRVVEYDAALNTCARELRRALGDDPGSARYIETLPKRGYRFSHKLAGASQRTRLPLILAVVGAALFASVAVAALLTRAQPASAPAAIVDANAADLLIRARHGLLQGDAASLLDARTAFGELSAVGERSPEARGGYALATALLAGGPERPWGRWTGEAERVARDVLQRDPRQADALVALGYIELYRDWDVPVARAMLDRALAAQPERSDALALRGAVAAALGDAEAAAVYSDRAALADPVAMSVRSDRCWLRLFARDAEAAVAACTWALAREPDHAWTRLGLAEALRMAGRVEEAVALFSAAPERGIDPSGFAPRADAAARWRHVACAIADRMRAEQGGARAPVVLAGFEAQCGRTNAALAALREGLRNRDSAMLFLRVDPRFDTLRAQAAFGAIVDRVASASE